MKTEAKARQLAESLVAISVRMGKPTSAILTRMDEPLGCMIGNSLEVIESIDCLKGKGPADLMEVTYALSAEMLILGGIESTQEGAMTALKGAINSGAALESFRPPTACGRCAAASFSCCSWAASPPSLARPARGRRSSA